MYRLVTSRTCSTCDWPAKWEDLDGTRYCDLHADKAGEAAEERAKAIKERADAEAAATAEDEANAKEVIR
jgi:hypothetical protein